MDRATLEWVELSQSMRDRVHQRLPPALASEVVASVADAYARPRLLAALARQLETDPAKAQWTASEDAPPWAAFARTREAEQRATTSARLMDWPDFNVTMLVAPPEGPRMDAVRRIDKASHRSQNVAIVGKFIALSLARAAFLLDCTRPEPWPTLRSQAEETVDARTRVTRSRVRIGLDFAYREIDQPELLKLARAFESPPSRHLHDTLRTALQEALRTSHRNLESNFQTTARHLCNAGAEAARGPQAK